jgi:ribosomal protein S18 acetylase RimI-like enzyme
MQVPPTIRAVSSTGYEEVLPYFATVLRESGRDGVPHFTPNRDRDVYAPDWIERIRSRLALPLEHLGWMRLWVAFDGEVPVGNVDCRASEHAADTHRIQLGIAISRSHRGRGLGRRLMLHAIEWARANRFAWIDLGVFGGNRPARTLYETLGFKQTGYIEDRFRIDGERIDEVLMALDLRQ